MRRIALSRRTTLTLPATNDDWDAFLADCAPGLKTERDILATSLLWFDRAAVTPSCVRKSTLIVITELSMCIYARLHRAPERATLPRADVVLTASGEWRRLSPPPPLAVVMALAAAYARVRGRLGAEPMSLIPAYLYGSRRTAASSTALRKQWPIGSS